MLPLELLAKTRPSHWVAAGLAVLLVEYATGPFIQVPILYAIPVALATATHGRRGGAALSIALPLVRLSFYLVWGVPSSWALAAADAAVDTAMLTGFSLLLERVLHQQREIRLLQGMLPICGFCKRIRDQGGRWNQLESYISRHSGARFSHTLCDECSVKHYPELRRQEIPGRS
jgi:hypothetical protein